MKMHYSLKLDDKYHLGRLAPDTLTCPLAFCSLGKEHFILGG